MNRSTGSRLCNELADVVINSPCLTGYRRAAFQLIQKAVGFDFGTLHNTRRGATGYGYDYDDATLTERQSECVQAFEPAEIRSISRGDVVLAEDMFPVRRREALRDVANFFKRPSTSGLNWGRTTPVGFIGLFIVRERGSRFKACEIDLLTSLSPIIMLAETLHVSARNQTVTAWAHDTGLSPRQKDVAELVVQGHRNREIALLLGCSELTVRNHLASVFVKARVQTRQQLIRRAILLDEGPMSSLPGYQRAERIAATAANSGRR